MTRLLANLHHDRGFDVSWDVERGLREPAEAFEHQYAWRMRDLALQFYTVGGDSPVFTGGSDPLIETSDASITSTRLSGIATISWSSPPQTISIASPPERSRAWS